MLPETPASGEAQGLDAGDALFQPSVSGADRLESWARSLTWVMWIDAGVHALFLLIVLIVVLRS